jgi:hypothetical protein
MFGQFCPAFEAVGAGDNELGGGEGGDIGTPTFGRRDGRMRPSPHGVCELFAREFFQLVDPVVEAHGELRTDF